MSEPNSLKQNILSGAAYGLLAWLAYGVIEFAFTCVIVRFFRPEAQLLTWQWPLVAMVFGLFAVGGLLLGAVGGVLLSQIDRGSPRERYQSWAAITLVAGFVINLIAAWPLARSENIALGVGIAIIAVLTAALVSKGWRQRVSFLASPWTVSLLLLASPWISREALYERSGLEKAASSILILAVIVGLARLANRFRPAAIATVAGQAAIGQAAMVCIAMLLLSMIARFSGRNIPAEPTRAAVSGQPARLPNLILITMDTVRADHLSVYGYARDTTPNLRDFARSATRYTRAIAASDFTLPSHASIFTGRYPSWHGAQYSPPDYPLGRPLPPEYTTLAEVLREHGYRTAAYVANYGYLSPSLGLAKGFDLYDARGPVRLASEERPFYLREGARKLLHLAINTDGFYSESRRAGDIDQLAFARLEQAKRGGPLFLFLNYMDAHVPYVPPAPFDNLYPTRDPRFSPPRYESVWREVNSGRRGLTPSERDHLISQYDGGIAYADQQIGKLLGQLRLMGLYDNTAVVITSDHGESFGEHGLLQHALGSVYQELVYVPLLIKYPAQNEPQELNQLASHVDLMPTLLDIAGIVAPSGVQGRTLRSLPSKTSGPVYSESTSITTLYDVNPRFRGVRRALFVGPSKLITWTAGAPELYDLSVDPGETHNLYQSGAADARELLSTMAGWTKTMPANVTRPGKLDKSSVERLKSLGYVQ